MEIMGVHILAYHNPYITGFIMSSQKNTAKDQDEVVTAHLLYWLS